MTSRARAASIAIVCGVIGWLLFAIGLLVAPRQALFSYLTAYVACASIALGALLMVLIANLSGGRWLDPFRPLADAVMALFPALALLFIPVGFGLRLLYRWAGPLAALSAESRESIAAKAGWLNAPFFLARVVFYFAVWIVAAAILRRKPHARGVSAVALPAVGFTLTFAAFDWTMSLSPEWFSSVYGVYLFAGAMVAALALFALAGPAAAGRPAEEPSTLALGKMLLTFVVFWAYIGFCQYLVIWIADLPVEVSWYVSRLHGSWAVVAGGLLLAGLVVPLLLLLFRRTKRSPRALARIGGLLLLTHYVDVYWLVMPELHPGGVRVHWLDLAAACAVAGTLVACGCKTGATGRAYPPSQAGP